MVVALVAVACGGDDSAETADAPDAPDKVFSVEYRVIGDQGEAELSYTYDGGSEVFRGTEPLPFSVSFEMQAGDIVDLGAFSTENSSVTCQIDVDGRKYREDTASGGNVALCQGLVGGP